MQPDAMTEVDEARLTCPNLLSKLNGLLHVLVSGMGFEAQGIYDKRIDNAPPPRHGCFASQSSHRLIRARAHIGNIAQSPIYGDMSFSLFNICMCAYGFWKWITSSKSSPKRDDLNSAPLQEDKGKAKAIVYRHFRLGEFGVVTLVTAVIWLAIYLVLKYLTNSPVPALDAFTTTLNIVGTWVLAQKIIEVWGYWFLVNLVSIYLYMKRGLHFTTILLYTFYLCASVYGWWKWRHYGKLQSQCSSNP